MSRPYPPAKLIEEFHEYTKIIPAPELKDFFVCEILSDSGNLYNEQHLHLEDADIEFMWASDGFRKQGRLTIGQAEQVMFMAGGWKKSRQEQQFFEWFGRVPKFIITLSARYCSECSNVEFCSLLEHELCHIVQQMDEFDSPKFNNETGLPMLTLVGHDVEEFSSIVDRYGAGAEVEQMLLAKMNEKSKIDIKRIDKACNG